MCTNGRNFKQIYNLVPTNMYLHSTVLTINSFVVSICCELFQLSSSSSFCSAQPEYVQYKLIAFYCLFTFRWVSDAERWVCSPRTRVTWTTTPRVHGRVRNKSMCYSHRRWSELRERKEQHRSPQDGYFTLLLQLAPPPPPRTCQWTLWP